jgi:hypothetical protein
LCLNAAGLTLVTDSKVIPTFLSIFTSPKYLPALKGRTPSVLGLGIGEMLRHHPALKPVGVGESTNLLSSAYRSSICKTLNFIILQTDA